MLPAYGYLTSFPCPYYVAGLCERPHCLFRHVEKDVIQAFKETSAAVLKSAKCDDTNDDASIATTSKDPIYKVPSGVKQTNPSGSSRKRHEHDPSTTGYKYVPASACQEVPTYSSTKAYVTPLNHALPLPASDDQELPARFSSDSSSKRISADTVENESKRRKVIEQDSKKENETAITNSNGNSNVTSAQKPSNNIGDQPENACKTKPSFDVEQEIAEWKTIIENFAAANKDKLSEQKSTNPSKEENEKKSNHSSSSSSSSKKEKSSREDNHHSSRTNSSSSSHSHKSKHSDKSRKDESSKDHKKSSSKDSSKSSSNSSSKRSHKSSSSSSRSSSSSKSPEKKARSKDHKHREEKERSSKHSKEEKRDETAKLKRSDSSTIPPEEFNFPQYDDSDEDPDEVAMECLKMFEDYTFENAKTESKPQNVAMSALNDNFSSKEADDEVIFGKKRLAHAGAQKHQVSTSKSNTSGPARTSQQLAKIMIQRMEAAAKEKADAVPVPPASTMRSPPASTMRSPPTPTQHSLMLSKKKRIAHVSNVNMLIKPQNSGQTNSSESKSSSKSSSNPDMCTIAQTAPKGLPRIAHPHSKILAESSKPLLSIEAASINTKVPVAFRQKILYQLHTEFAKWFSESVAAERARKEESEIAGRCSSKMVYFSAATNAITRIRRGCPDDQANSVSLRPTISPSTTGSTGSKVSWSIEGNKKSFRLPVGVNLYQTLAKLVLTEEDLTANGFPMPHPSGEPGRAISTKTRRKTEHKTSVNGTPNPTSRQCERCNKPYRTDIDGMPLLKEKCIHHFGRQFNRKSKGLLERRYTCCDGDLTSEGCCVGETHVSQLPGAEDDLTGFVSTVKDPGDESIMGISIWDIVALDCEMVYTTVGSELARVTIVDCHRDILYDQLVMPPHPILDYNTRFSGITEEIMLKGPTVSLIQVQAVLLTQLRPNSILIGHSLESDLHALKIIHRHVIDTSVLFPHRLGPPYKRALRTLSAEYCGQIIQSSVNGHNSSEDALAALDLVFYKLKELS